MRASARFVCLGGDPQTPGRCARCRSTDARSAAGRLAGCRSTGTALARLAIGALTLIACHGASDAPPSDAEERAVDELLLDSRADGATLAGRLEPASPNTDGDRVIVLRGDAELDGMRVLDARFVGGGVAILGADRVLRFQPSEGAAMVLDESVYGPLSIARDTIAYVRGAPPDLELARASVRTGAVEQLTRSMAPMWSPALSSDGAEIVFVSGREGSPRLYLLAGSGAIEALPPAVRTPSAATAPRWSGSTLVFEDEAGVARLDLNRGVILDHVTGARGLVRLSDGSLAATVEGRLERVEAPR